MIKEIRDLMARCSRLERQVAKLPTRIGNSAGGGGTGTGDSFAIILAESKADLPPAGGQPEGSIARIIGVGSEAGMICIQNAALDGWDALNRWE